MIPLGGSLRVLTAAALVVTSSAWTSGVRAEQPASAAPASATDVSRIKRVLDQPSSGLHEASTRTYDVAGTTFHVSITQPTFNIWKFWGDPETIVAPYVRPWAFSGWHHEYVRMVTPEYGRRAALYPPGIPVTPAINGLVSAVKQALRARSERKAKEEVQEALEAFFAEHPYARPAPAPPPAGATRPPGSEKPPVP